MKERRTKVTVIVEDGTGSQYQADCSFNGKFDDKMIETIQVQAKQRFAAERNCPEDEITVVGFYVD